MLTSLFSEGAIALELKSESFSAAVEQSVSLLVSTGHAKPEYVNLVLANLAKLGPYFVVAPGIALAHAVGTEAVITPGLSLLKLETGVHSGSEQNDPVQLVFALCTPSPTEHIELLSEFARAMSAPGVVNSLLNASAESVIREILEI